MTASAVFRPWRVGYTLVFLQYNTSLAATLWKGDLDTPLSQRFVQILPVELCLGLEHASHGPFPLGPMLEQPLLEFGPCSHVVGQGGSQLSDLVEQVGRDGLWIHHLHLMLGEGCSGVRWRGGLLGGGAAAAVGGVG